MPSINISALFIVRAFSVFMASIVQQRIKLRSQEHLLMLRSTVTLKESSRLQYHSDCDANVPIFLYVYQRILYFLPSDKNDFRELRFQVFTSASVKMTVLVMGCCVV
jgi:hypothetical protein